MEQIAPKKVNQSTGENKYTTRAHGGKSARAHALFYSRRVTRDGSLFMKFCIVYQRCGLFKQLSAATDCSIHVIGKLEMVNEYGRKIVGGKNRARTRVGVYVHHVIKVAIINETSPVPA